MKIKDLEYWKDRDLIEEFSVYSIYNEDIDDYDLISGNELDYNKKYEFDFFDEDGFDEFCNTFLVKNNSKYLVFAFGYGWRHLNGYKFVESVNEALYRNYDCTFSITGVSRGEKNIMMNEYSHDNPMGCTFIITSLTDKEYDKLCNADFKNIESFAEKQLGKIVTKNKKEKYKAKLEFENGKGEN